MLTTVTFAVLLALVCSHANADFCCPKTLSQTDSTRKIFLDFHNDVRRKIALGQSLLNFTAKAKKVILGPAQNMYKL
ncbi:hypothetical protein TELCIR_25194, partial [Teladorsagia circumcincta]